MRPKDHYNNTYNYEQEPYNDMQTFENSFSSTTEHQQRSPRCKHNNRQWTAAQMMHSPWTLELRTKEKESTTIRVKESTTKEKERHNGTTKEKDIQDTANKDTKAKVQHRLDMATPSRNNGSQITNSGNMTSNSKRHTTRNNNHHRCLQHQRR